MMRSLRGILLGILTLSFAVACHDGSPPDRTATDSASKTAAGTPATLSAEVVAKPVATLADGVHVAYGLTIPRGFVPMGVVRGVARFAGKLPQTETQHLLRRQVTAQQMQKESDGALLLRGAEVMALPSAERVRLGVRVNTGPSGETMISVWPEPRTGRPSPPASVADRTSPTTPRVDVARPSSSGGRAASSRPSASELARRRQTFEVMGKLERGEPLSSDDYRSELFY